MTIQEAWRRSNDRNKCEKNRFKLCSFQPLIEDDQEVWESCEFCGKKVYYNKEPKTGRIDNARYLADHIRATVQPFGETGNLFLEIYGTAPIKELEKMRARRGKLPDPDELRKEAWDTYKTLERIQNKGYRLDKDKI